MSPVDINEKHYKLIGVAAGCSWNELRRAYKKQIQKFHPDRFEDDSILKFDAEEHIKSLNLAYYHFQTYYKKNGHLPPQAPEASTAIHYTSSRPFKFKPEDTQDIFQATPLKKKAIHPLIPSIIALSTFIALAYFAAPINDQDFSFSENSTQHSAVNNNTQYQNNNSFKKTTSTTEQHLEQPAYSSKNRFEPVMSDNLFSYGSTMGNVIDAQGIPDKSSTEIWHYGQSKVFFENGLVIKWSTHNDDPLNTTISVKTESHRNNSN